MQQGAVDGVAAAPHTALFRTLAHRLSRQKLSNMQSHAPLCDTATSVETVYSVYHTLLVSLCCKFILKTAPAIRSSLSDINFFASVAFHE
jgi:hypothetical protein